MPRQNILKGHILLLQNGSTENGTVRESDFLAAIRNRLYFCKQSISINKVLNLTCFYAQTDYLSK